MVYSICSDYYSLGVTILSMMLGKNPMQLMKWDEIQKCLKTGTVPGIDINHLRNTPYDFYSEEDKVMYLVLGLMLPNPSERWGYGEIRCWCNGQHIPLTRKDGKIVYQYNEPFIVGNYKCWNYQQLTRVIAANSGAWNDTTYTRLDEFAKKQNITIWKQISDANKDSGLTANGRIFRAIYGINPALDGFWWSGKKYADTSDLIREVATNKTVAGVLSEILKNHSMSYFLRMRKRISSVSETEISEMEQIEQWEISEPDKGVNRCIMKFSSNAQARSFWVGEKEYKNIDQLLGNYANSGLQLKKISCEILNNKNFQAWLWANGMEDAGRVAQKMGTAHPEQGFYLLLKIAESVSKSEDSKKLARKIYLTYGEYAPVYWLVEKTDNYKMVSIGDQILFDTFKDANLSLMDSIEKLSAKASQLVADYQHFVSRTAKSPLEVECVDLEFCDFSFYPLKEDGFFCCKWENDLEVTPAFLRAIGESIQKKTLETWSEKSVKAVDEKLDRIIQSLPVYGADTPGKSAYIGQCNSNIVAAIVSMFVSAGILLWFAHYTLIGWGSFFASLVFPITNVKVLLTRVSDNPNHRLQMFVDKGFLPETNSNKMYVGDPVSLDRELNFHPQENVWIAGGSISDMSSKAANSLMMFSVLSLTMEALKNGNVEIYCTNFNDYPMRSVEEEENDRLGQLTSNFPAIYKYNTGSHFVSSLQFLLNEMESRQNGSKPKNKAIWWFIVRPELMSISNGAGNVVIDLKELLQEGPKNNIHVVIWTGDVKKAQMLQLNKSLFKERICMEMSTEESKLVNGEDLRPMPTGFKAVLIGQNAMRFRVYDLPDGKWMNNLFDRLNSI